MDFSECEDKTDRLLRQLSGKCIAVTGAGGFIGSTLLQRLVPYSVKIRALLGTPGDPVWDPPQLCEAHFADISDLAKLVDLMRGAEVVVHAAGSPSVHASFLDPTQCVAVHTLGTVTVIEACQKAGVRRLIYLSSAEVYGAPSSNPVSEEFPIQPLSPYGAAKAAAEMFVRTMAAQSDLECCILRPFSVYGPRQSSASLIATILSQAKQDECVWLSDLKPVRDYCYVQDVVEAIALACAADVNGGTFNIGSGEGTSVKEIAELILRLQNIDIPIRQKAHPDRPPATEIYQLVADIGKAKSALGWQPRTSLADGLGETMAWMKRRDS